MQFVFEKDIFFVDNLNLMFGSFLLLVNSMAADLETEILKPHLLPKV